MAFASGATATISINGIDLSSFVTSVKFMRKGKSDKYHLLNSGGVVTLIHDPENSVDVEGLFDPTIHSTIAPLVSSSALPVQIVYQPQGAVGGVVETCLAYVSDFEEDTPGDKGGTFKATFEITGLVTG